MPPRAASATPPRVRDLDGGTRAVNILGTGVVEKPAGAQSWITYWERHARRTRSVCCAQGCCRTDVTGAHVKLAAGPMTALLHTRWYIVPACHAHNKRDSCKTYAVKPSTVAVEAPPSIGDRLATWPADFSKAARSLAGKR